jgi:cysteinylglycine-S-conjugate dipeptidase
MSFDSDLNPELLGAVRERIGGEFAAAVGLLGELVKIRSIAWPSFDPRELEVSAQRVAAELTALELFDSVEIRRSLRPDGQPGAPAVVARRAGETDAPHVLLYAHHDVQPPGNPDDWNTAPFELTLSGERVFGRGASDDKAGIVTHLMALKVLAQESKIRLGISVFIEGEEEAGSPSFKQFLQDNRDDLAADLIVVADSGNIDTETASLTNSLRGLVSQVVTVRTLDHAVHSGMYSGPVPDAMLAMTRLLASLHTETGDVAVAGLRRDAGSTPNLPDSVIRSEAGVLAGTQLIGGRAPLEQNWFGPAITVIGIDYPAVSVASNTMHPAVTAKISMRIAPSEKPEHALRLLRQHLTQHVPFDAELEFGEVELGSGYLAKNGWAQRAAASALELAWGKPQQPIGIGGSIPFIAELADEFPAAEILVTGVEDGDSRAHAPNESQHLPTLRRAMEAEAMLLLHGNSLKRN